MGKVLPGIVLAFANSKGGSGKSTLTAVFAGYLYTFGKKHNIKVAVIDADDAQNSLGKMRHMETGGKKDDDEYEIISISSNEIINYIDTMKKQFDIILIDFPGNLKQAGVIEGLHLADIVIIPFEANKISLDGTFEFYNIYREIQENREREGLETIVRGVPNRVTPNLIEYKELVRNKQDLPFELLENHVKESKVSMQRNITTLNDDYSNDCNEFCEEVLGLITNYVAVKGGTGT